MIHTPKLKLGDFVKVPLKREGHEKHDTNQKYRITRIFYGPNPENTHYALNGFTELYPETRLKKVGK